ncbi:hypothetical protein ABE288_10100 [Bacillus salipaludis]|uniref:hypothetical protein n=1 Tax=Bacillus salipaludis TaxID=2547811 RepID=UPI003D1B3E0E
MTSPSDPPALVGADQGACTVLNPTTSSAVHTSSSRIAWGREGREKRSAKSPKSIQE